MKNNRFIFTAMFAAGLLATASLHAQDAFFSQYFASPMRLNPALTGKGVDDWRLASAYRVQWQGSGAQPYSTAVVSAEKNLFGRNNRKDALGAGIMVMSDVSNAGLLKHHFITAGLAYNNALDAEGKQFFGGGLSVSYTRRMLDASKFVFQSQFGSGGYQPSTPSNDGVVVPENSYFDINAGLHYSIKGNRSGFYTGLSYFHANKPKDGVYENTGFTIDPRFSMQMGYQLYFSNNSEIHFTGLYDKQGKTNRFTAGMLYKQPVTGSELKVKTINFGLWNRFSDATYFYVGIEGGSWLLGLSYDVPSSRVSDSFSNLNSFEISFGWLLGKNKKEDSDVFAY